MSTGTTTPAPHPSSTVDPAVGLTEAQYSYANDNPANGEDPLGLWGWNPVSNAIRTGNDTRGKAVHGVQTAAVDTGQLVSNDSSTLSTSSTALSGLKTYRACFDIR